jgi:hypothetical protein
LCYTKANNCIFKIYDDVFIDHWQWTMNSSGRPHSLTTAALDVRALLVMRTSHSIEKKNKNFVVFQQQLANDGHISPRPSPPLQPTVVLLFCVDHSLRLCFCQFQQQQQQRQLQSTG